MMLLSTYLKTWYLIFTPTVDSYVTINKKLKKI